MGGAPVLIRRSLRDLERRVLKAPPGARRYLKRGISVDDFFEPPQRHAGVRYAALRWFETLPEVEPGEDIDLLIGDDDLEVVATLLEPYPPFPATQKLDLYTASGLPGTDFRGMPYLGKRLADQVLDGAVLLKGRYRVPSPSTTSTRSPSTPSTTRARPPACRRRRRMPRPRCRTRTTTTGRRWSASPWRRAGRSSSRSRASTDTSRRRACDRRRTRSSGSSAATPGWRRRSRRSARTSARSPASSSSSCARRPPTTPTASPR